MTTLPKAKMTVDEFLVWAEDWPDRYELVDGKVYAMWPERAQPARKLVIHHRRATDMIETRIASEGLLPLDSPGIKLAVEALFAED